MSQRTFSITSANELYLLTVSLSETNLYFSIKSKNSSNTNLYESFYSYGKLIDIDKKFKGYSDISEIYQEIQEDFSQKKCVIEKSGDEDLILVLHLFRKMTKIPILLSKDQKSSIEEKLNFYQEEAKRLSTENDQLRLKMFELEGEKFSFQKIFNAIKDFENDTKIQLKNLEEIFYQADLQQLPTKEQAPHQVEKTSEPQQQQMTQEGKQIPPTTEEVKLIKGKSSSTKIFELEKSIDEEHTDFVSAVCLITNGRLASASYDNKIKIFNLSNYKCEMTLKGHKSYIYSLSLLDNGVLVSGSEDKTVKLWEIENSEYKCIKTFYEHNRTVWKVIGISNNRIASCSADCTIIIRKRNEPYDLITTLTDHTNYIFSIIELTEKTFLVSGGLDKTIRFWNLDSYKCDHLIEDVFCRWNHSLIELGNSLIVGGEDEVVIINLSTITIQKRIKLGGIQDVYSMTKIDDDSILCGGKNALACVNIKEGQIIKDESFSGMIFDLLLLQDKRLVSCSDDCSIKFWKRANS